MSLGDASDEHARTQPDAWLCTFFGLPERLKGQEDPKCRGCLVDVTIRRVLPCSWNT